jgi:hypothetical protein
MAGLRASPSVSSGRLKKKTDPIGILTLTDGSILGSRRNSMLTRRRFTPRFVAAIGIAFVLLLIARNAAGQG